ncbi:GNAT family N-acetyltransferase [Rhodococcus tibetensis]|uniref:GNAT family N-acetyltransferase n=1 Tax=Rhodococcus tibetensis TaxID=2965064 RepID=A0ABT1QJH3_9NOCA|nr:GNAT family N-acetyltransferase [Rhodococcus sp. FXJ9.536]MCQ4122362.1 GNAT family N-acetyltransferase [Rhodococcus sp. FXJ9.536]
MTSGYPIRPLEEDDFLPIHRTLTAWWDDWGDPQAANQRMLLLPRLFFQHFADISMVVTDPRDEVAAYLIGFMSQSRAGQAYIHFVGVHPDLRGHGLGGRLYRRFFELCASRGATRVSCVTSPGNIRSIGFHRALGFEVATGRPHSGGFDVQPDYDGKGLDRVCFVRSLEPIATPDIEKSTSGGGHDVSAP